VSLGRRIAVNAAAAFGNQIAMAALGLLATAVLVRTLGIVRFGAWGLVAASAAWAGMLDLGLGLAAVRRVATCHAAGDDAGGARAAGAALLVSLALGLMGGAAVWLLAAPAAAWFNVPEPFRPEFVAALRIAAAGAALTPAGTVLGAVPTAFQRLDALIKVEFAATGLTLLAQTAAAALGGGLVVLAGLFAAGRAANLALRWNLALRSLPGLRPRWVAWGAFWRDLGGFGALKVVHQLSSQAVLYLDRFLVGFFLDVRAVAYYTVAMDLAQRLLLVPSNLGGAFYPAACAAAGNKAELARLYSSTSRAVALLTFAPAVVLFGFAGPLLEVWVGGEFAAHSAGLLRVSLAAYALMALTAVPAGAADALGRPDLSARYGLASVAINATLAVLLIPRLGVVGSGWAVLLNGLAQSPFFVRTVTTRLVGLRFGDYLTESAVRPLLPSLALGAMLVLARLMGASASALGVAVALLTGLAAFSVAARGLALVSREEGRFLATLPGGRLLLRMIEP
jgi:O-antigen/teichoic acid export membrane protein